MQDTTNSTPPATQKRVRCDQLLGPSAGRRCGQRCTATAKFYWASRKMNLCGHHATLRDVRPGTGPSWSDDERCTTPGHEEKRASRDIAGRMLCVSCSFALALGEKLPESA